MMQNGSWRSVALPPVMGRVVPSDDAAEALLREVSRLISRIADMRFDPRADESRIAIVLHLSRLAPPAPRPHHRRIARALMQDTVAWSGGQMFSLANGDLALICPTASAAWRRSPADASAHPRPPTTQELPDMLRRLLRVDTPSGLDLVSVWPLASHARALQDYARARVARQEERLAMEEDISGQTGAADALGSFVGSAAMADLLQRQSAIVLTSGAEGRGGIRPLYREVTFSIAGLEARVATAAPASSDPFLFRHLASRLDPRMLDTLSAQAGNGGPLDVLHKDAPKLHINLTLQGVLSADFARLAATLGRQPGRLGVEISLVEAVADSTAFTRARAVLAGNQIDFVLDGVSHLTLLMTRPALFDAALIKLDWSPRLAELPQTELSAIERALREIGVERVVLHRAETELALRWGLARGIRRFQGRHVDSMLGAARIVSCTFAESCTLRQCIERAGAANALGRAGCRNTDLLDACAPPGSDPLQALFAPPPATLAEKTV